MKSGLSSITTILIGLLPWLACDAAASTIQVAPGYDIDKAYRLAVAAECTYHINRDGPLWSQGDPLKCLKVVPEFAALHESDLVAWIAPDNRCGSGPGIDGYLLIRSGNEVILAIRGTQPPIPNHPSDSTTLMDWLNDFNTAPKDGFHAGFLRSWECIRDHVRQSSDLAGFLASRPGGANFLVTGHSKGGAISIIAAIKMSDPAEWPKPLRAPDGVYAFEAARPVTIDEARKHPDLSHLWRLEYKDDIVPLLPPGAWLNSPDQKILKDLLPGAETIVYDSAGLGNLYRVDQHNDLRKINDEHALLNQRLNDLTAAYLAEITPLKLADHASSGTLPMCSVIVNNHVAHVPYLRALAQGTPPARDEHIPSSWDRYCTVDFVNEAARKDFISRFTAICEKLLPPSICKQAR
jgi:hypothetical protein